MTRRRLAGAIGWCCLAGSAAGQPLLLGIGTSTSVDGVSLDGSTLVGGHSGRACQWTMATGLQDLTPGNGYAWGANGDGSVVVGVDGSEAVRWIGGVPQPILPSPYQGVPLGTTSDGETVVGYAQATGVSTFAFLWRPSGLQDLGRLSGGSYSAASDISADGTVIAGRADTSNGAQHAVRWDATGIHDLGVTGYANAVSPDGTVIVGAGTSTHQAFRAAGGGVNYLGILPGMQYSEADDVSDSGNVVVGYCGSSTMVDQAFVWTAIDGMRSLSGLLNSMGQSTAGWTLRRATGISADGTVIAGYGEHNGQVEGFVAVIPAPGITVLPSGALLLAAAGRPRRIRTTSREMPRQARHL